MSTLKELKTQLHSKPIVHSREPIFINLEEKASKPTKDTSLLNVKIQDKRSEGYNPDKFLSRIKQTKLSIVVPKKDATQPVIIESKAPEIIEPIAPPVKIKKIKSKLGKEFVIMGDNDKEVETNFDRPVIPVTITQEDVTIGEQIEIPSTKKKKTKSKTPVYELDKSSKKQIGDTPTNTRLPENPPNINIKVSSYYMNNREIFVNFLNGLFEPYRKLIASKTQNISCDNIGQSSGEADLLTHQKIVRDYINLYTPYRGLLLFHGLGSGKTFSSIAIAEGFKSTNRVIVMTPASLRRNYLEEIKKYGDLLYRKNQFWEWISTDTNPETLNTLSEVLGLSHEFIIKKHGAWLVNVSKSSNYDSLSSSDRKKIDEQIDAMIQNKYTFINYNGLRVAKFNSMTDDGKINIFDNAVVIIDEAHNLISRIVNKINRSKPFPRGPKNPLPESLSLKIYELLLRATNCRVVLLTGTPMINYPNEIGILYNILRGYIKSWNFTLNVETTNKINVESLSAMFLKNKIMDYIGYSPNSKILTITRNPYGFENKITSSSGYKGVTNEKKEKVNEKGELVLDERGVLSDEDFIKKVVGTLRDNGITAIPQGTAADVNTALPDTLNGFINLFIDVDAGDIHNVEKFKKRIVGLTSFFKSAQEELLPAYEKNTDLHVLKIPMSDYQFKIYEEARVEERLTEKPGKDRSKQKVDKNGIFIEPSSTYRIFSRLFCNFVMPNPPGRPKPVLDLAKFSKKLAEQVNLANELAKNDPEEFKERLKRGPKKTTRKAKEPVELVLKPVKTKKNVTKKATGGAGSDDESEEEYIPGETKEEEEKEEEDNDEEPIIIPEYQNDDVNFRTREELEGDEVLEIEGGQPYREQIKEALNFLKINSAEYLSPEGLTTYGPKFLSMLDNIQDPNHLGLHLIYSQFRTMEGIGIFCLVLEQNGFARFKIKKTAIDGWDFDMTEEELGKPKFALYTGTEEAEEREIIRNIYNSDWQNIPTGLATKLKAISSNNFMGEIIKILMITAAGSEGINLRNTRYVHLMEPYWHPVRLEQVIGRARRICSHKELPRALQTVEVFLYLMTFTAKQLASDEAVELKTKDLSKKNRDIPLSSDEKLFEISSIKEDITGKLLKAMKEASIDCAIHSHVPSSKSRQGKTKEQIEKEQLHCLSFGNPSIDEFTYNPSYTQDENDTVATLNKDLVTWTGREVKLPIEENGEIVKKLFIIREGTNEIYDYDTYKQALEIPGIMPVLVGHLERNRNGDYQFIPL
jgi:hypothetical protein